MAIVVERLSMSFHARRASANYQHLPCSAVDERSSYQASVIIPVGFFSHVVQVLYSTRVSMIRDWLLESKPSS